jgi:predicted TIM-barrel fold metal-dependent hydrolase
MQRPFPLFDCWASYGARPDKDPHERWTLVQLLADLDFAGFGAALVRHEQALHYDPMFSNRRLAEEVAGHEGRLCPCWLAMPHHCGDFPSPGELAAEMVEHRVRALWFAPATHGYPIHADLLGPLAEELASRSTLLLLPVGEAGRNYRDIAAFCRVFSANPVVLTEGTWGDWRLLAALMDACPNAHLEFSAMQGNRAVEWFAGRYGVERCLLGTGLPRRSAGAARGFVDWSLLAKTDVTAFGGGNLARLLRVPSPTAAAGPADEIMYAAWTGRPVPVPVLDAHCHVLHDGLNGGGQRYVMPQGDLCQMLDLARRIGVDLTAVMSWNGTVSNDVVSGNRLLAELARRERDDVTFLASCDPTHQSPTEIEDMCEHLYSGLGFRGMKPYMRTGISYADPGYAPFWECAARHHLYGLLHVASAAGGMRAVADLAQRYPTVMFLVAHSGMSWSFARQVAEVAAAYPNVGAELTYTAATNGVVEWLCGQIGCRRVCFGTDAPMRDPRPQLAWCVNTRLHPDAKRDILGRNFARVLARAELPGHGFPPAAARALSGHVE